jgi:hypothetical protein
MQNYPGSMSGAIGECGVRSGMKGRRRIGKEGRRIILVYSERVLVLLMERRTLIDCILW